MSSCDVRVIGYCKVKVRLFSKYYYLYLSGRRQNREVFGAEVAVCPQYCLRWSIA